MTWRAKLSHFRDEHDDLLRSLQQWEEALKLVASEDCNARRVGLDALRLMEKELLELREHCHNEEHHFESPFKAYLDEKLMENLRREHELIERMTEGFRSELKILCTPPPTDSLVSRGHELLAQLRHHIAFEEGLLKQIEEGHLEEEKKLQAAQ